jgi:tRNA threonylcarbamoyladenosine biosynthesis protein TsaE
MITKFHTKSVEETEEVAKELAKKLNGKKPELIAMFGDLGVGKTAFVRGLANILAPNTRIKSPTYTIVNEHNGANIPLYHFDMYRIEDEDELYSIGFYDYADRRGVCLTEWSENIEYALPEQYIRVEISKNDASNTDSRSIAISLV